MMNTKQHHGAKALAAAVLGLTAVTFAVGCNDAKEPVVTETASNNAAAPSPREAEPAGHGSGGGGHAMGGHAMGSSGLNALKTLQGKEFDIAFLSQMIAHHEAAVMMAKQALATASKPETKMEAQKVIDAQTKEIAQMTGWLKGWYGAAPSKEQRALVNADMKGMMEMPVTSDAMFFEMMIPHHQGAIDMSGLVPARSERPEVKKLAERIIRDQKAEIAAYQRMAGQGG